MKPATRITNRREFVKITAAAMAGLSFAASSALAAEESKPGRKFTICLSCRMIGVAGGANQLLKWASQYDFESIEPPESILSAYGQTGRIHGEATIYEVL